MILVESVPRSRSSLATPASDSELVARVAAGDAAAFTTLMRRHNRQMFRTARSILKSDAEAEDAVQEAYLRAWRAIDGFRSEAKLSTWLVRIVINESLGRLRRARSAHALMLEPGGEPTHEPAPAHPLDDHADHQPEGVAMRAEMRRLLEASIDRLPDGFRSVFILRAVEEMSVDDVAAALGLPHITVRTRLFRARLMLRQQLSRDVDPSLRDAFSFGGARCDRIVARVLRAIGLQDSAVH